MAMELQQLQSLVGCFQLSENCSLKNLIPFDSWIKEVNECNGHSKITQKYDSDWILLIPFDSTNQMVYLKKVVTCVTAKFCFGNQKESVIQLMIHSFMVNQITEWMILNWKQPTPLPLPPHSGTTPLPLSSLVLLTVAPLLSPSPSSSSSWWHQLRKGLKKSDC